MATAPNTSVPQKNKKNTPLDILAEFGITSDLADDFITHRKAKKSEITKTVMRGFQRESDLAGIQLAYAITISIENNWQGFKSEWYKNQQAQKSPATATNSQGSTFNKPNNRTNNATNTGNNQANGGKKLNIADSIRYGLQLADELDRREANQSGQFINAFGE